MNSKKIAAKPAKSAASAKINLRSPVKATAKVNPRLAVNHNETLLVR